MDEILINKEEAKVIRACMLLAQDTARSDEPHVTFGDDYLQLLRKLRTFVE